MILVLKGISGICFQTIFLRESISNFFGNEFSISLILSFWLLGGSIGSLLLKKRRNSLNKYFYFTVSQNFLILFFVFLIRTSRIFLGGLPGVIFSFSKFFIISLLPSFIVGLLEGARFILASSFYKNGKTGGKIYAFEGIGNLIGGILFILFLKFNFSLFYLIFIFGFINLVSIISILKKKIHLYIVIGIWIFLSFFSSFLEKKTLAIKWSPFYVSKSFNSLYNDFAILSQKEQLTLLKNGIPEISNQPDTYSIKNIIFFSLLFHRKPEKILIMGRPDLLFEMKKYPIKEIKYLEIDYKQIEVIKKYFIKEREKILFEISDPYAFLAKTDEKFDIIFLGYDLPLTLVENRFFTIEFLTILKRHLTQQGLISISLSGSPDYIGKDLLYSHSSIYKTFKRVFLNDKIVLAYPIIYLFSENINFEKISFTPYYEFDNEFFNPFYLNYVLDPKKQTNFKKILLNCPSMINTNFSPTTIYYSLSYWFSKFSPNAGKFILKNFLIIFNLKKGQYLLFLFFFIIFGFIFRKKIVMYSIGFSNGFLSISFELLLLFLFQINFGYLYFFISVLISFFMIGLSSGGFFSEIKQIKENFIVKSEFFHLIFYFIAFISLFLFKKLPLLFYGIFLLTSGFFVGFEFGLLTFFLKKENLIEAVGNVYSLDLLGALLGCFCLPFLFLPMMGFLNCIFLFTLIKLANFLAITR